jgi:hypothetical protein
VTSQRTMRVLFVVVVVVVMPFVAICRSPWPVMHITGISPQAVKRITPDNNNNNNNNNSILLTNNKSRTPHLDDRKITT